MIKKSSTEILVSSSSLPQFVYWPRGTFPLLKLILLLNSMLDCRDYTMLPCSLLPLFWWSCRCVSKFISANVRLNTYFEKNSRDHRDYNKHPHPVWYGDLQPAGRMLGFLRFWETEKWAEAEQYWNDRNHVSAVHQSLLLSAGKIPTRHHFYLWGGVL